MIKNPFRKKVSLRFRDNFPEKRTIVTQLNDPIITPLATWLAGTGLWSLGAGGVTAGTIALAKTAIYFAIAVGGSLWSMVKQKKGSGRALGSGGIRVNTRSPSEPVKLIYGKTKVGCNWIFCETTGPNNDDLYAVVTLGEGEINGIPKIIDEYVEVKNGEGYPGVDDMQTKGTYTGTQNRYVVEIVNGKWLDAAAQDDGGARTDETTAARNDTTNDMSLFPAAPALNDAYIFGIKGVGTFNRVLINVSTPGVGTWALTWEIYCNYGDNQTGWVALDSVVDGTNGFHNSGLNAVTFGFPALNYLELYSFPSQPGYAYAIRARISAFTSCSTPPKATKAWISNGADETYRWNDGGAWSSPANITTNWVTLSNGAEIKFDFTAGHKAGQKFSFYAGDGIWLGERLMAYYKLWDPYGLGGAFQRDLVSYTLYKGTSTQVVDPTLSALFPTWRYALRYTAYIIFKFSSIKLWIHKQLPPAEAWSGAPEIKVLAEGLKLYDPRTSITAYSRTAALVWNDLMQKERYAFGIGSAYVDNSFVNAAANWCEANGYYFDGEINIREDIEDVIDDVMACFRGFRIWSEGKYKLKIFADDSPVKTLDENDIEISPESFSINIPGIPESPNRVKIAFFDAERAYTENFVIWEDQVSPISPSEETPSEIPIIGVTDYTLNKKLSKYYSLRSKYNKEFPVLAHPRLVDLEPGDMIQVTHEFPGWTAKKVRVKNMGLPQDGMIPMTLIDENAAIYDQTVDVATRGRKRWIVISPTLPTPSGLSATTASDENTINKSDAYIEFTWAPVAVGIDYSFFFKKTGGNWDSRFIKGSEDISVKPTIRIGGLVAGAQYKWVVYSIKTEGRLYSAPTAEQTVTAWSPVTSEPINLSTATGQYLQAENEYKAYITFSWTDVNSSYRYELQYRETGASQWQTIIIETDQATSVYVPNLKIATLYEWRVRSESGRSGYYSSWVNGTNISSWSISIDKFKNLIINGNALIDQAVSGSHPITTNYNYGWIGDRFQAAGTDMGSGSTSGRGVFIDGRGWTYAFLMTTASGTADGMLRTKIISRNASLLKNKKASLSFKCYCDIACGAWWEIRKANSLDNFATTTQIAYGSFSLAAQTHTPFKAQNISMADCSNGFQVLIWLRSASFNANYGYIYDIQLEQNEIATSFENRLFETELALCKAFFQKSSKYSSKLLDGMSDFGGALHMKTAFTDNNHIFPAVKFSPPMWAAPTITAYRLATTGVNKIYNITDGTYHPHAATNVSEEGFLMNVNNSSIAAAKELWVHYSARAEP